MIFEWKKEYEVGVEIIDEQHKGFVLILGDLYDSFLKNKGEEVLTRIMKQLDSYSEYHFATEERYFKEFKYEGMDEHIKEHDQFRARLEEFKQKFITSETDSNLSLELLDVLENWLIDHVNDMDKKYAKCFKDNGLK